MIRFFAVETATRVITGLTEQQRMPEAADGFTHIEATDEMIAAYRAEQDAKAAANATLEARGQPTVSSRCKLSTEGEISR